MEGLRDKHLEWLVKQAQELNMGYGNMERLRDKADEIITQHTDSFSDPLDCNISEAMRDYGDYILDMVYETIKHGDEEHQKWLSDKIHELKQQL